MPHPWPEEALHTVELPPEAVQRSAVPSWLPAAEHPAAEARTVVAPPEEAALQAALVGQEAAE